MAYFVAETVLLLLFAFVFGASIACMVRSFFIDTAPVQSQAVFAATGAAADVAVQEPQPDTGIEQLDDGGAGASESDGDLAAEVPVGDGLDAAADIEDDQPGIVGDQEASVANEALDDVANEDVADEAAELAGEEADSVDTGGVEIGTAALAGAVASAGVIAAASEVDTSPAPETDHLTRIAGIGPDTLARLAKADVSGFDQIANWTSGDVERIELELGEPGRVSRENWIEQAAILATGAETLFARRQALGETDTVPTDAVSGETSAWDTLFQQALVADGGRAGASDTDANSTADDIVANNEGQGGQLAGTEEPEAPDDDQIAAPETDQPNELVTTDEELKDDQTAMVDPEPFEDIPPAPEEAAADTVDVEIRPVSAEPVVVAKPAEGRPSSRVGPGAMLKSGEPDDLKRVSGIGVVIERKLFNMGITQYVQIAAWTADDIVQVNQALDFHGRVERENWIEQARILSGGGRTSFAQRVDKGAVASSKPKE